LRVSPQDTALLTVPVRELEQNCRVVLTVPGKYSYSIWSGVPAIEEKRINSWPFLWPEEALTKTLPKLREQDQGCALVSEREYQGFKKIAVSPGKCAAIWLSEIQRTMTPVFSFQDIVLYKATGPETTARSEANLQGPKAAP